MKPQELKTYFKGRIGTPSLLLTLSIISIVIVALSIYYEYRARQRDYLTLMDKQATLFIKTLSNSVQNTIKAAEKIESEINDRIIASLKIIEKLDQHHGLSQNELEELLSISSLEALYLYNNYGKLTLQATNKPLMAPSIPFAVIHARLKKTARDTILTIYDDQNPENEFLAAFVTRKNRGLIAAIIGKDMIRSLRRTLGIGYYLKRFQSEKNIEYIVIQNSETIVAGSFNGYKISSFSKDPFLNQISPSDSIQSRIIHYDERLIFETISLFRYYEQPFGVLRLGLSMNEYERLQKDVHKRLFLLGAMLVVFGLIFINFLISYRHRKLLQRDLLRLQDYTNTILENLVSGVISVDQLGRIQTVNKKALQIFNVNLGEMLHKSFTSLPSPFRDVIEKTLFSGEAGYFHSEAWQPMTDHKMFVTLRTNIIKDQEPNKTLVLLIDDVTDQTRLEEQLQRNQRLTAMRKLASSVAHEIKNPLNAINLIIDLIKKKSESVAGKALSQPYLNTVQNEIKRISTIIDQYLRFARPPEITLTDISFPELFDEIAVLYESQMKEKNIIFRRDIAHHRRLKGDIDQLKQVFINLIKNAEEAIEGSGEIRVIGREKNNYYEIRVSDTGKGIDPSEIQSIFDFYFTTKPNSSGIGLSVVQQIMAAHSAKMDVESEQGVGTTFILQFPIGN